MNELKKCPKVIAEAMAQVQSKISKLENDARNEFSNYKYSSIDAYYDFVRPLLVTAGLLIIPNENHAEISPDGKTIKVIFDFILMHSSGEVWEVPIRRTVYIENRGAQACGAALSYADKFIMRTLFKISTGEVDLSNSIAEEEVEKTAKDSHDADSMNKKKATENKKIVFNFAGAPYRIFNREGTIHQTYTDLQTWGNVVERIHKKDAVCSLLRQEISRVQPDIDKYDITPAAKQKMHSIFNQIMEEALKKKPVSMEITDESK